MNKITTLTAFGLAVLLMLSVMPASAIKEVSSFESHGPIVNATEIAADWVNYTANELPMFYIDLDSSDFNPDIEGESLSFYLSDEDTIDDGTLVYKSNQWTDDNLRVNIAWLGEKYLAVGNEVTKLSKYLVDFESDEKITLKQGDVWDIGEGFTLSVVDIDINGKQVWLTLEQDGSAVEDLIANPEIDGGWGYYNDTLAGESDVVIARIHVDKVFAGMTANMAIIDDAQIISLDVMELDDDEYFGMDFNDGGTFISLTENDGDIGLSSGKTKDIIQDFLSIRVGDTDKASRFYLYSEITEPGIYEQHGSIVNATANPDSPVNYTANELPMFYIDLDSVDFDPDNQGESFKFNLSDGDTIDDGTLVYQSNQWTDDNLRVNIAWLGEKYLAVGNEVTKLSKYLVDFESDEKITLKQGDVWDIGEGFTLSVVDIDINGKQVWLTLEQDGSAVEDLIANPEIDGGWGYYNDTLAGESDVVIARIHVDKVFAGMTANMAIIDDAQIISLDVMELDDDEYFGMDFNDGGTFISLTENDGDIGLSSGKTKEIIKDFLSIRVGDVDDVIRFYVYNEVQVGEVTAGPKPTGAATEEPTVDVNATVAPTTVGTTVATAEPTVVVTPTPTKPVPGFEAVFAIAGLLAVAYLVLRKRE